MKKLKNILLGIAIGAVNILIGSCGGIVAVESLKKNDLEQTKAHATAIAVILPLSLMSAIGYIAKGEVRLSDSYIYLIPGLIGSVIGSWLLPKIPQKILNKFFSVFMIYAGVRMLIK